MNGLKIAYSLLKGRGLGKTHVTHTGNVSKTSHFLLLTVCGCSILVKEAVCVVCLLFHLLSLITETLLSPTAAQTASSKLVIN